MPKYVVHVGPSKTASTYLQSCFRACRDELRAAGIVYPDVWWVKPTEFHHARLARALAALKESDPITPEIANAFADFNTLGNSTILLSAEALSGFSRERLMRFRGLLGENDCEIVFYFRRWSDRIPSEWQQRVRSGDTIETLPERYARALRNPSRWPINYSLFLEGISAVFGEDALRLISLSSLTDEKIDVFQHFREHILHLPNIHIPSDGVKSNESFSIFDTELMRALSTVYKDRGEKPDKKLSRLLTQRGDQAAIKRHIDDVKAAMEPHVKTLCLNDDEPALHEAYDRLSAKYRGRLLNPTPQGGLFEKRTREIKYVHPGYLSTPHVRESLARIADGLEQGRN
jgi:hypothetical protein